MYVCHLSNWVSFYRIFHIITISSLILSSIVHISHCQLMRTLPICPIESSIVTKWQNLSVCLCIINMMLNRKRKEHCLTQKRVITTEYTYMYVRRTYMLKGRRKWEKKKILFQTQLISFGEKFSHSIYIYGKFSPQWKRAIPCRRLRHQNQNHILFMFIYKYILCDFKENEKKRRVVVIFCYRCMVDVCQYFPIND